MNVGSLIEYPSSVPIYNEGSVPIPAYGVFTVPDARAVSPRVNEGTEIYCRSTLNNGEEGDGTFQSDMHYHNRIGFNGPCAVEPQSRGYAFFELDLPITAAVEGDVSKSDILIATSDTDRLRALDRGTNVRVPGDYTNIFAMFRPLRELKEGIWLVSHISNPMFVCKVTSDYEEQAVVADILQHGSENDGSIDVEPAEPERITYFEKESVSEDDVIIVGLVAGALVRTTGSRGGGGGGESGLTRDCGCGNCVKYGMITACSVFGEAPQKIYFPNPHPELFEGSIELEHVSGCTWESDTVTADLNGNGGAEEYFFRLVFSGTGPEDVVLSLEQV